MLTLNAHSIGNGLLGTLVIINLSACNFFHQLFHCNRHADNDWVECVRTIEPPKNAINKQAEIAYQAEIALKCTMRRSDACSHMLTARYNVDSFSAATRLLSGLFSPAQYLAVVRDRQKKISESSVQDQRRLKLCNEADSDGDFVPDSMDRCPATPDLTPTDNGGCTDPTLPRAPAAEDVRAILNRMNVIYNPQCQNLEKPVPTHHVGPLFMQYHSKSTNSYMSEIGLWLPTNQSTECRVIFQIEIEDKQGKYDLLLREEDGSQFQPAPGLVKFTLSHRRGDDPNTPYGRVGSYLAQAQLPKRIRYRAIGANGLFGSWSENSPCHDGWSIQTPSGAERAYMCFTIWWLSRSTKAPAKSLLGGIK